MQLTRKEFLRGAGVLKEGTELHSRVCAQCLWWRSADFKHFVKAFCAVSCPHIAQWIPIGDTCSTDPTHIA